MNKFESKINRIFAIESAYGIYDASYVKSHISNICIDEKIESDIHEFDILISLLSDFYNNIAANKKNGNYIELGKLLLIREYINDIKAIREMAYLQLENQMLNAARNFMERTLVVVLSVNDDKFCNELFLNSEGLTEKQRFYNLFRPKSLISRIESSTQNTLFTRGGAWDETYSLFSKFVHNDVLEWLKYYEEGYKYNISLSGNISKYFWYRTQYIIQSIIFSAPSIMVKYKDIKNNYDICRFFSAYMQATIDIDYKKNT